MLIPLALLILAVSLFILVLFSLLLVSIRREDRGPELACRPPTMVTALTRRLCGLHVRRRETPGPADDSRLDSCLALHGTSRSSGHAA